ncbi:MAG: phage major capsid protein [Gammaproteobacteria bacterium]|nr:phage major capsid protein [Gammaproteobacteria bacterium]
MRIEGKQLCRAATVDGAVDEKSRRVRLSFSSEEPYERSWGVEILDHSPGAVRLDRFKRGAALLLDHDPSKHIGVIEQVEVSGDRKGRAVVRFGRAPRAEEAFRDVIDGIRNLVSVGYRIHKAVLDSTDNGMETYRVTDWEPYEISLVSVPADPTVGIGRAHSFNRLEVRMDESTEQEQQLSRSQRRAQRTAAEVERERAIEIAAIGARFKDRVQGMDRMVEAALNGGTTIDAFRELVMDKLEESRALPLAETRSSFAGVDGGGFLSQNERQHYSLTRAIESLIDPRMPAGFELEVSDAAAKRLGRSLAPGRICIPHEVLGGSLGPGAQRDLTVGTPTAGGHVVGTNLLAGGFIDLLRNASSVMDAGATVLPDLVGNVAIPRKTAGVTGAWVAEGNAPSEGDITFDQVTMTPKTCAAFVDFSRKMRLQATPGAEQIVRTDLATAIALAIDLAALNGSGTPPVPRGVMNVSGIGSVAGGTDGAAPTWDHLVNLDAAIANANAPAEGRRFITNSKVAGKLRRTQMFSSTNGETVWQAANEQIAPVIVSNQVPSNLTKGSSNGICSAIVYGAWAELLIGMWGALELMVDPYTFGTSGGVRVIALQDVDIAVRHAASFAAMADALTT